ncbi:hypothetical protein CRE_22188 [Caenorhabditis remanei]|uniref:Uncharacterized protein n=1 Tax=Caenorhabditis remanei TaxID=31234 RepID=E3NNC5_CAERE|nr:hypothetical protein CRE_22188 [Caenorhabditis remanei]
MKDIYCHRNPGGAAIPTTPKQHCLAALDAVGRPKIKRTTAKRNSTNSTSSTKMPTFHDSHFPFCNDSTNFKSNMSHMYVYFIHNTIRQFPSINSSFTSTMLDGTNKMRSRSRCLRNYHNARW